MSITGAVQRLASLVLLSVAAMSAGACADAETKSRKFAASGDAYVARQQFKEAIIEYRRALAETPGAAEVRYKLGRAYQENGDLVNAYTEYARAGDANPSNVDAHMRAGTILLLAREFEAAKTRGELALKADPRHVPAHILVGNARAGLNDTVAAQRQIQEALKLNPSAPEAWTALGAVTFMTGRKGDAAVAFKKAVELGPQSIEARLALANFQWATHAFADAEATLKSAIAIDAGNAPAHRALALLYITTNRRPQAEAHFKALAVDPPGRLALADYYMGTARNAEALEILREVAKSPEKGDSRQARLRIASIEYGAGRKPEAHRIIDELLQERPRFAEARTAKARMLLSDRAPAAAALAQAREAVKADPYLAAAQFTLGLAAMADRKLDEADKAFEEAVKLSPQAAAARIQQARVKLARGDAGAAVLIAELAANERPTDTEAAVLLAQSLRASGNLDRAANELTSRLASGRGSAGPLQAELGWLELERGQPVAAKAAFNEALRQAPSSTEVRKGLISADLANKKVDAARSQVAKWEAANPEDVRLKLLSANVELSAGNWAAAEQTLKDVIAADASQLEAYETLGRVYVGQGKVDAAIQQYDTLASRSPSGAAGARTMIGMLEETRQNREAARAAYEKALAADPTAGVAANNLAWIYGIEGKLDEALRLATIAQASLRRRPEAEDTLGWIYLQKGLTSQAIASFERARVRAPKNPVYHYHLGLAHLKAGDARRARAALAQALQLKPDFAHAADAREKLAEATAGTGTAVTQR